MKNLREQLDSCQEIKFEKTKRQTIKLAEKYYKKIKMSQAARKNYRKARKSFNNQKEDEYNAFYIHLQKKYSTLFPDDYLLEKKKFKSKKLGLFYVRI